MSNMSYCRFENTADDLRDCVGAMDEVDTLSEMELSESELRSMKDMWALCNLFMDHYERLVAMQEDDDEVDYF